MAEQMRPASKQDAPDPANSYERTDPGRESGMGRLDADKSVPSTAADNMQQAVGNKQNPQRQVNGQELTDNRAGPAPQQPDHSMHDEEPLGSDQAPTDIKDPKQKRHPRTEGKGGTP